MPKSFYLTSTEREIASSFHGTKRARLTQDAQRNFDSCGLCLSEIVDPVATPSGYLYCRECILENLLTQSLELSTKRKAYDAELKRIALLTEMEKNRSVVEEKARFEASERGIGLVIATALHSSSSSSSSSSSTSLDTIHDEEKSRKSLESTTDQLLVRVQSKATVKVDPRTQSEKAKDAASTAFWTSTPNEIKTSDLLKPDPSPRDPVSGVFLRAKELIKVNWTLASVDIEEKEEEEEKRKDEAERESIIHGTRARQGARIACPVCLKGIVWQKTFLLKLCGHVLCENCVMSLCLPSKECAVCSSSFPKDEPKTVLLALQVGGSSFANGAGTQAESFRKTITNLI